MQHSSARTRVPSTDVATDSWTIVNLSASHTLNLGATDALLYAKLHSVSNTLAYSATSLGTMRPLSPLPGRALQVGLKLTF